MYDGHETARFAALRTGVRLAYVEEGPANGTPVVFLHGVTDTHRSFDLIRPHMPRGFRLLAPTMRGHGESAKPMRGYHVRDMAEDVAAFLDAKGIARAVIVGHSMGTSVALHTAAAYPARVAGVALLSAFADYAGNPAVDEMIAECATFGDAIDPAFARAFQESTLAAPAPHAFFEQVVSECLKAPAFVWRQAFEGFPDARLPETIARVRAPALVVWGDKDAFCPHADQLVLQRSLRAQLVTMPDVGHAPHWERPRETATTLAAFINRLEDSWWS